jgi:hypothetical protein
MYTNPRIIRIPHERIFQNDDGISIRRVDAFRITVKSTTESANESVTRYGYHHFFSVNEPARMTGSTGRTHGASIVKIPATNEAKKRVIIITSYIRKEMR